MAVVRARSSPPYALIVFVFLTVIAAGIAIWLAAERGAMAKDLATANEELVRVRKNSERPLVDTLVKGARNESALGVQLKQVQALEDVIENDGRNKPVDAVTLDAKGAVSESGGNGPLISRLGQVVADLKHEQEARTNLEGQVAKLTDQMKQASDENKQAVDEKQATLEKITKQLAAVTAEGGDERQKLEKSEADAQIKLTDTMTKSQEQVRQLTLQNQDLNQKLGAANIRIADLTEQLHRGTATAVAMAPAGIVVRATPGTGECYINLGRADRIMVGLTFSVHDPRIGIKGSVDALKPGSENEDVGPAAGKGGLEVEEVGDTQSLCRITKTMPGQIIQAGDLLSNPVYQNNKNRKNHFVIFGDFDLDGDGVATAAEHDRIVHLVTEWGGVIDDKLSTQTDFLVLGTPPAAPNANADMTPGSPAAVAIQEAKDYGTIEDEAKHDGVPILNANRFLAMVGYYNTTIAK